MFGWLRNLFSKAPEEDNTVKYLIAGLGNMGPDYEGTRHNIGFEVVEALAAEFDAPFEDSRYGFVARFKHKGRTFILLKPTTFMNLSGKAVLYWGQKEKIKQENFLVIVDDLNINFGAVRIKAKGGAGGHNGLKDIEARLGNANYPRLRVGIGNKFGKGQQANFVLGKWNEKEEEHLDKIVKHAASAVKSFATIGLGRTANSFNADLLKVKKKKKPKPQKPQQEEPKSEEQKSDEKEKK